MKKRVVGRIAAGCLVVIGAVAVPDAASAYSPNPAVVWMTGSSGGSCAQTGDGGPAAGMDLGVGVDGIVTGDCRAYAFDDTHLTSLVDEKRHKQNNGQDLVVALVSSGRGVAGIAFMASGDVLTVNDTYDDGDTVYVWIGANGPYCACQGTAGENTFSQGMDLIDGGVYALKITDDKAGTDVIAKSGTNDFPYIYP